MKGPLYIILFRSLKMLELSLTPTVFHLNKISSSLPLIDIHPYNLYQPLFSTLMRWRTHHIQRTINFTDHYWSTEWTIFIPHSKDLSTWLTSHHDFDTIFWVAQWKLIDRIYFYTWYDIVHFEFKPSFCSWTLPQEDSYRWGYYPHL